MIMFMIFNFVHLLAVVVFLGALVLAVVQLAAYNRPGAELAELRSALITAYQRVIMIATAIIVMAGFAMIMGFPGMISHSPLMALKIVLGLVTIGLAHLYASYLRRLNASDGSAQISPARVRNLGLLTVILGGLVIFIIKVAMRYTL